MPGISDYSFYWDDYVGGGEGSRYIRQAEKMPQSFTIQQNWLTICSILKKLIQSPKVAKHYQAQSRRPARPPNKKTKDNLYTVSRSLKYYT